MKVLFTFEYPDMFNRSWQLINFFQSLNIEPFVYNVSVDNYNFVKNHFKCSQLTRLDTVDVNDYDYWIYDVTLFETRGQETETTFLDELKKFKGKLICINYEDGSHFFEYRLDDYILDKTDLFIRPALYRDRDRYHKKILNKLFLTTSYIDNSQFFINTPVSFEQKIRRAFFTGSITGHKTRLTNYSDEECIFRLIILEKVKHSGIIPCLFGIHGCDPAYIKQYTNFTLFKQPKLDHEEYIKEFSNSLFILALKGNGYNTNRFFESQAAGCVTVSNNMDEVDIYGIGEKNKDWIEFDVGGDGIVHTIQALLDDPAKCKQVCDGGRKCWEKYNMIDTYNCYSKHTYDRHKAEFFEKTL